MPRAQADVWVYFGLDTVVPDDIMEAQRNRQITTTENLTRLIYAYESPDVFDKVIYINNAPAGSTEAED